MNAENFAVAISTVLLGFTVGVAFESLLNTGRVIELNTRMKHLLDDISEKDDEINRLNEDLLIASKYYKDLYDAVESSRQAFENVKRLSPPPRPLIRSDNYVEEESQNTDFQNPATPSIYEPSNRD